MDLELLKTFRELHRTRHFGHAANNLFVSQSTVSARIKLLEEQLGVQLFDRDRNNIRLTPAGSRFLPYVEQMLDTWVRARQTMAAGERGSEVLMVAGLPVLWDLVMTDWLANLTAARPRLGLSADALGHDSLLRRLLDGLLDLGFMFEQPRHERLLSVPVYRLQLSLLSTEAGQEAETALGNGYVYVDWGQRFASHHAARWAAAPAPRLRVANLDTVLVLLRRHGGAAYLPRLWVEQQTPGWLYPVAGVEPLELTVYAVYRRPLGEDTHMRELLGLGGLKPLPLDEDALTDA